MVNPNLKGNPRIVIASKKPNRVMWDVVGPKETDGKPARIAFRSNLVPVDPEMVRISHSSLCKEGILPTNVTCGKQQTCLVWTR